MPQVLAPCLELFGGLADILDELDEELILGRDRFPIGVVELKKKLNRPKRPKNDDWNGL